ncbi:MAG: DnaJ domain-containing protein [Syntrophobacter sp.]
MDNLSLNESEIFAAFRLLFTPSSGNLREVLNSMREPEIKSAFRKKALQTHPDRFASFGEEYQRRCSERFIEISNAYETLTKYLKVKDDGVRFQRRASGTNGHSTRYNRPRQPGHSATNFRDHSRDSFAQPFWKMDLPKRHLRFGEFLYFSGMIPWPSLIRALVWQRKQRPRLGEIAQRWRWLTELEVTALLKQRHPGVRLGELLLQHKIISPFQLSVLLWQQRKIQKPIGQFFVQQEVLSEAEIRNLLRSQLRHNRSFSSENVIYQ